VSENVYNQTLFRGGLRRFIHMGRFLWVARRMAELDANVESVVELGCYDGRVLEHVRSPLHRYVGYDANWGGGLDLARTKWSKNPRYEFRSAQSAADIDRAERFDVGVCMETLEHVADELVDDYIDALATVVRRRLYVTVPNEKYFPFAVKYLYHAFVGGGEPYAPAEVVNAALGRLSRVARDGHKGFDYDDLIRRLERRFIIDRVEGQPVPELPPWVSTGVSIIAHPRARS
jgi:hypothetical protein